MKKYLFLLIGSITFLLIGHIILGEWWTDDAFISFRYAKNFVNGLGLVYNEGEYVQGYTNFLYIILLSLLNILGISFKNSALLINIISYLALGFLTFHFLSVKFDRGNLLNTLAVLLILSSSNLITWTVGGGLEGPLFSFIIFFSVITLILNEDDKIKLFLSGILFGIATLIRPEGILFFAVSYLMYLYVKRKIYLTLILGFLFIITPYFVWVFSYYGDLLPNTFYAKVYSNIEQFYNGIKYTYRFLMSAPFILGGLIFSIILYKKFQFYFQYFLSFILIYIVYTCLVGGDFMYGFRFYIPIITFLQLLLTYLIVEYLEVKSLKKQKLIIIALSFLILFNLLTISFSNHYKYYIKTYDMIEMGQKLAYYFNDRFPKEYIIATSGIGSLGFYSNNKILDVLGLTEKKIAKEGVLGKDDIFSHNKSNSEYIGKRLPEIIVFASPPGKKYAERFAEKQIYKSKWFDSLYVFRKKFIDENDTAKYYLLKDLVN